MSRNQPATRFAAVILYKPGQASPRQLQIPNQFHDIYWRSLL
jgi:hypothetical protein